MPMSAGIVPVQFPSAHNNEPKYLILRSGSYWDFPKGMIEEGELPLEAAIRELKEESGLDQIKFTCGCLFKETEPYGQTKKIARYYLAEVTESNPEVVLSINPSLGFAEHEEFRWVTYFEGKSLLNPRVGSILDWADKEVFIHLNK